MFTLTRLFQNVYCLLKCPQPSPLCTTRSSKDTTTQSYNPSLQIGHHLYRMCSVFFSLLLPVIFCVQFNSQQWTPLTLLWSVGQAMMGDELQSHGPCGLIKVLWLYPELREAVEEILAGQWPDQIAFWKGFSYGTSFNPCNNTVWGGANILHFRAKKKPEAWWHEGTCRGPQLARCALRIGIQAIWF